MCDEPGNGAHILLVLNVDDTPQWADDRHRREDSTKQQGMKSSEYTTLWVIKNYDVISASIISFLKNV